MFSKIKPSAAGVILLVVVSAFGYTCYKSTDQLLENNYWVSHTLEVLAQSNKTQSHIFEADATFLRYIITEENRFKIEFDQLVKESYKQIDRLKHLTADNLSQQDNCNDLRKYFDERLGYQKLIISKHNNALVGESENNRLKFNVVDKIEEINYEENRLLKVRQKACEHSTLALSFIMGFGSLLIMLVSFRVGHYYSDIQRDISLNRFMLNMKDQYAKI